MVRYKGSLGRLFTGFGVPLYKFLKTRVFLTEHVEMRACIFLMDYFVVCPRCLWVQAGRKGAKGGLGLGAWRFSGLAPQQHHKIGASIVGM